MRNKRCILILGGVRSGKSQFAQKLAQESGKRVLFVATAQALDQEMNSRIEEHRKVRPPTWQTLEATCLLGPRIEKELGDAELVIIDCLTLLLSNLVTGADSGIEQRVQAEMDELIECMNQVSADFIIVSNEVGSGIVPDSRQGRIYRDLLGKVNQMMAQRADEVYVMFAGIPVRMKGGEKDP
jgi:adenosylcobinamide kinase/adenosylcobinamide-phosphate guanylyltransferase